MAGSRKRKRRRKNIVRFPGGLHLNIGIISFLFIAVYLVFHVYSYFTSYHISSYEVGQGTIEVNTSYTGLILRKETVVNASHNGRLDYYLKDNTKAGKGVLVCSIDENGNVSDKLNEAADTSSVLTAENLASIQNSIQEYAKSYDDGAYYTTYNFKSDLSGKLMEAMNLGALEAISDYTDYARENQTFHLYQADQPGVVAYYTDGLEAVTADMVTENLFDLSAYKKNNMKTAGTVESGQPVYKLITDENWQIVVPIEPAMKEALQEDDVVEIRFKEDNTTAWANYTIEQKKGTDYLILSLRNSMIRYAYERYIDIHILLDQQTGLKIPNSSITTKTFELVPDIYFTKGNGASNQTGLMVEHKQENGAYSDAEFVPVTVYYQEMMEDEGSVQVNVKEASKVKDKVKDKGKDKDDATAENEDAKMISYISNSSIQKGDLIVMPGSTERYEISKTAKLKGVYNINKGYAVFKQINELYHNDNYTIVEAGTEYGIMLYDHIALDGDSIHENQMISR